MNRYCERTFEAGSLTKELFVEYLMQDFIAAKAVYDALERTRARKAWREAQKNMRDNLIETYSRRYKKATTIDKYVNAEMTKWIEKNRWRYKAYDLNSIKFSIKPWENGGCYYVYIDKIMEEYLGKMWDMHINNKYLHGCIGWAIVFDKWEHYLDLTLPEELEAEWKEDERKLGEEISRFYRGTTYWGD